MVKPRRKRSSEKNKFSAYEFGAEDRLVEKESRSLLSKFRIRNPSASSSISPLTKYSFLQLFAGGKSNAENEPLDVDDYDKGNEIDVVDSPCSPRMEISCSQRGRKLESPRTDGHHNEPLCIDSDDEHGNKESLQSLPICVDSDDDLNSLSKDSVKELSANDDSISLHSEPTVVLKPDCIYLGKMYSTASTLTFSRRSINLEGLIVDQTNRSFDFTWQISDVVNIKCFWCRKLETAMLYLFLRSGDEKIAKIDGELSEKADTVKLIFCVHGPNWSEKKEAIESLDSRYKTTLETVHYTDSTWNEVSSLEEKIKYFSEDPSANGNFEGFLYPEGDPDAVSICKKDVELLKPATFINDTIIDFYVKYLEQDIKPDRLHRCHFFNCFFFRKLADLDRDSSATCEGRAAFERVRKWTRKVNLFEKDFIFIPVNFSLHWSLIIICHPGEAAYRKSDGVKSSKVPCILHFDSIRGYHRGLKNLFQSYLWEEWKERHSDISEDVHSNFLKLPFISLELPQQQNSFDCGLFLLYYLECFMQQAPLNFSPFGDTSNFLNKKWFKPAEASSRRGHIKSLIYKIYNENTEKHCPNDDENPKKNVDDDEDSVVESNTGKGFLKEACDGRQACRTDSSAIDAGKQIYTSAQATPEPGLINLGGPKFTCGDISYERAEGTYQRHEKKGLLNRRYNFMSPIEEEEARGEQTASSSTRKTVHVDAVDIDSVALMNLDDEDVEISLVKPQISADIPKKEEPVVEALLVSTPKEGNGTNAISLMSDDELECHVVPDSYKDSEMIVIDDNDDDSEARSLYPGARKIDFCDLEDDDGPSTSYDKADHRKAAEKPKVEQDRRTVKNRSSRDGKRGFKPISEKSFYM